MNDAIDIEFGELIKATEILEIYGISSKNHAFACPKCNVSVFFVNSTDRAKHFSHKFSSPDCERYTGSSEYIGGKVTENGTIYKFESHQAVFEKINFIEYDKKKNFEPDLFFRNYFTWIYSYEYIMSEGDNNFSKAIEEIIKFRKIGQPIFYMYLELGDLNNFNRTLSFLLNNFEDVFAKRIKEIVFACGGFLLIAQFLPSLNLPTLKVIFVDENGEFKLINGIPLSHISSMNFLISEFRNIENNKDKYFSESHTWIKKRKTSNSRTILTEGKYFTFKCKNCQNIIEIFVVKNKLNELKAYEGEIEKMRRFDYNFYKNGKEVFCNQCRTLLLNEDELGNYWNNNQNNYFEDEIPSVTKNAPIMKFNVGDEVIIFSSELFGKKGRIIDFENTDSVIELEENDIDEEYDSFVVDQDDLMKI